MIRYYHILAILEKLNSQQVITLQTLESISPGYKPFMEAGLEKLVEMGIARKEGDGYGLVPKLFDIVTIDPLYPGDTQATDYNKKVEALNDCRKIVDQVVETI